MDAPVVSIIMATYNRGHFLEETFGSILSQTFRDWECIVIDDGSSDQTEEILLKISQQDERIKFFHRGEAYRKGLPGCRNMGLDLAKGTYIIFFDDDDLVHPQNLEICTGLLKNSSWAFCRYNKLPFGEGHVKPAVIQIKPPNPTKFLKENLPAMVTGEIPFASCAVMWKASCFRGTRFNENLMYAEEWECYSRILIYGCEGVSISDFLYFNRKHPNSNTGEFRNKNPVRVNSQMKAAILVIQNLATHDLLHNRSFEKFFVRMSLELKSKKLLKIFLSNSGASWAKKVKYNWGFTFYPILRPLFKFKGKIIFT